MTVQLMQQGLLGLAIQAGEGAGLDDGQHGDPPLIGAAADDFDHGFHADLAFPARFGKEHSRHDLLSVGCGVGGFRQGEGVQKESDQGGDTDSPLADRGSVHDASLAS
jgi:hypothetical protein